MIVEKLINKYFKFPKNVSFTINKMMEFTNQVNEHRNPEKKELSKIFTHFKNILNICNLNYYLFYYTISNNYQPTNDICSIKKYRNSIFMEQESV